MCARPTRRFYKSILARTHDVVYDDQERLSDYHSLPPGRYRGHPILHRSADEQAVDGEDGIDLHDHDRIAINRSI
jgi:hypothetical protein